MDDLIKNIKLDAQTETSKKEDSAKGTLTNPYSQEEFATIPEGTWKGGYVEGAGYVAPANRGSNPDTGNVLYPGIYVDAGRFRGVYNPGPIVTIWWTSGYTGNINYYGDPHWNPSNIYADMVPRPADSLVAYWVKVSDGVYKAAIAAKPSDAANVEPIYEYPLELLELGYLP